MLTSICLAIGLVAFVVIAIFLKPPPRSHLASSLSPMQKVARIDFGGAFLLIAAFVCLLLALQWGGTTYAWSDSRVWGCLLGFGLIVLAFAALQIQLKHRSIFPHRSGVTPLKLIPLSPQGLPFPFASSPNAPPRPAAPSPSSCPWPLVCMSTTCPSTFNPSSAPPPLNPESERSHTS